MLTTSLRAYFGLDLLNTTRSHMQQMHRKLTVEEMEMKMRSHYFEAWNESKEIQPKVNEPHNIVLELGPYNTAIYIFCVKTMFSRDAFPVLNVFIYNWTQITSHISFPLFNERLIKSLSISTRHQHVL